ncbi:unnamed protein product [Lactuca virosa]|uniref:DUF2828 domain-containing protein n=1 Tax=Lactuca virosa TaxID=75947 RepID=A0AAU9PD90_9ASTR|nr:unnamed protein product [Lactuca virosa]
MEMKAKLRAKVPREQRIEANRAHMKVEQERAKASRKEKISAMAEKLQDRYNSDEDYKNLHDQVSSFFAYRLKSDIQSLNSGDSTKISLAAKWCPSVDSSYDNATLICESIARMIYPRNSNPEFDGKSDLKQSDSSKEKEKKDDGSPGALTVLPLYAMLPGSAQLRVFEDMKDGNDESVSVRSVTDARPQGA